MTAYSEFRLRIDRGLSAGTYGVVATGPSGEALGRFKLPFSDIELENFVLKIGRTRSGKRRAESPEMELAKAFGGRLFSSLFDGDVKELFRSSLADARTENRGLRISLSLTGAPELGQVPWEYLYDHPSFMSISTWTPIVRSLDLPKGKRLLQIALPLRIIGVVSAPSDAEPIDVASEKAKLGQALAPLVQSGAIAIDWLETPTLLDLHRQLRQADYHVLHYIGHGGYDPHADDGVVLFEDDLGRSGRITGAQLGTILRAHVSLRLAVFNACEGGRSSMEAPFVGVATSLIEQEIPAVIGMQFEMTDRSAIVFASEFYAALADGYPVDSAMAEARKAIYADENDVEWATPVLFMCVEDGLLFEVPPHAPARAQKPDPTVAVAAAKAEADAVKAGADAETAEAAATAAALATTTAAAPADAEREPLRVELNEAREVERRAVEERDRLAAETEAARLTEEQRRRKEAEHAAEHERASAAEATRHVEERERTEAAAASAAEAARLETQRVLISDEVDRLKAERRRLEAEFRAERDAAASQVDPNVAPTLPAANDRPLRVDENVQFTVYRPRALQLGRWSTLVAFAHLSERRSDSDPDEPDPLEEVRRQAEQVLGQDVDRYLDLTQDSSAGVPREGEIMFLPTADGVDFNPPSRTFKWLESVHREEFRLRTSAAPVGQTIRGRMSVFLGVRLLAEISLQFPVTQSPDPSKTAPVVEQARAYRRIFASYSHRDIQIAEQFEHYAAVFGDRYLRDWIDLRAGENWSERLEELIREADVFQLFWSRNSMRSANVRREWEYALALGRPNFIRPTYWEFPMPRDQASGLPPPALSALHFHRLAVDPVATPTASAAAATAIAPAPVAVEAIPDAAYVPASPLPERQSRRTGTTGVSIFVLLIIVAVTLLAFVAAPMLVGSPSP